MIICINGAFEKDIQGIKINTSNLSTEEIVKIIIKTIYK